MSTSDTASIASSTANSVGLPVSIKLPQALTDFNIDAEVAALTGGSALVASNRVKSYVWWTDDPWVGLLAVAVLVFVTALVAMILLLNRYNK